MPFKDPAKKAEWQREKRKEAATPEVIAQKQAEREAKKERTRLERNRRRRLTYQKKKIERLFGIDLDNMPATPARSSGDRRLMAESPLLTPQQRVIAHMWDLHRQDSDKNVAVDQEAILQSQESASKDLNAIQETASKELNANSQIHDEGRQKTFTTTLNAMIATMKNGDENEETASIGMDENNNETAVGGTTAEEVANATTGRPPRAGRKKAPPSSKTASTPRSSARKTTSSTSKTTPRSSTRKTASTRSSASKTNPTSTRSSVRKTTTSSEEESLSPSPKKARAAYEWEDISSKDSLITYINGKTVGRHKDSFDQSMSHEEIAKLFGIAGANGFFEGKYAKRGETNKGAYLKYEVIQAFGKELGFHAAGTGLSAFYHAAQAHFDENFE